MATKRSQLREGMLREIADRGMTPEQFGELLLENLRHGHRKSAGIVGDALGGLPMGAYHVLTGAPDLVGAAAIGIPAAVGVAGGSLAYGLTRPDPAKVIQKAKRDDLLRQLQLSAREAKRKDGTGNADAASPARGFELSRPTDTVAVQ